MANFDSVLFETSWALYPGLLFIIRALIYKGIYCLIVRVLAIAWPLCFPDQFPHGRRTAGESVSYFTTLANWGVTAYFLAAAVHTFSRIRNPQRSILDRRSDSSQQLHAFLYTTICVFPLMVSLIYWTLLHDGFRSGTYHLWNSISDYVLVAVFALFEMLFSRAPVPSPAHLFFLMLILWLYVLVAVLTFFDGPFWVYSYLDPAVNDPVDAFAKFLMIMGLLVALFLVVRFAIKARVYYTERAPATEFRREHRAPQNRDDIELGRLGVSK